MKKRRPPRAWIAAARPPDPAELLGPRGLTAEVLCGELNDSAHLAPRGWRFYWNLLSDERKSRILSVIAARLSSVTVVLDRLLDPHNTAAILRTSEGLGVAKAHIVSHESQDALAHRRVTQDADKWLDVEMHPTGAQAARTLRERGYDVWAGHLDETAVLYTDLRADRPIALLFGNEHEGPSKETLAACTGTFRIPMAGFTQSFNVSVAAGIALAQVTAGRRARLNAPGDLPEEQRVELQQRFTLLAARLARRLKSSP
ncbi:MAG: TrmH family RNA methyltransferase [Myxococcales bacterium]|nr:RNA methyltransferase [Myxococcales bacterium]